jgi:hypothetical protein
MMHLLGRLGDLLGNGPIATNSLIQMMAGNAGDSAAFAQAIGFIPRALEQALNASPAQAQDHWHARLFFLAPALRIVLVLLWLASGLLGLFNGTERTIQVVGALGWPSALVFPLQIGSSLLDLAIAALVLLDSTARRATPTQCAVILAYTALIGWALPGLWFDPLGALFKNLPILALVLVHGAIADKR